MKNNGNRAKRNVRGCLFAFVMIAVLPVVAHAQAAPGASEPGGEGPFVIRRVDFDVTGRSLAGVMMRKIDPAGEMIGSSYPDKAALEAFIADRRQVLLNERVLASVATSYDAAPSASGGYDVDLHFATEDTWNIIALPYPKYDSNIGLLLSLRGRDYDFAGSMQELALNLDYKKDTKGRSSYTGDLSFSLPLGAPGAGWAFGFAETGGYWTDGTASSVTSLSLGLDIPNLGFPATAAAYQGVSYNALASTPDLGPDPDAWFLTEGLAARATIPLTGDLGALGPIHLGPLNYAPSVAVSLNWKPGASLSYYGSGMTTSEGNGPYGSGDVIPTIGNSISYGRGGIVATVGNGLSFGRVDWAGNMRDGLALDLVDTTSYNAQYEDLASDLNLDFTGYMEWGGKIGVAARATVIDRFSSRPSADELVYLGWYLRGIIDARITGTQGAFVNLGFPIKLFDFPTHAIIKTAALDFELQMQPFLDAAWVRPDYSEDIGLDQLWYSGGLEFLVFPKALRSFIVRASAGWDLKNVVATKSLAAKTPDGASPYEVFLGLGLMY
jgi:hypothetical protein